MKDQNLLYSAIRSPTLVKDQHLAVAPVLEVEALYQVALTSLISLNPTSRIKAATQCYGYRALDTSTSTKPNS